MRDKPHIIRAAIEGQPKTTAINMADVQSNTTPISPLSADERRRAKALWPRVGRYLAQHWPSQSKWVESFTTERTPDREIRVYERMADALDKYCAEHFVTNDVDRMKAFMVMFFVSMQTVDVPSRLEGVADDTVALIRTYYDGGPDDGIVVGDCDPTPPTTNPMDGIQDGSQRRQI